MSEASNRRKRPDDPRWQTVREALLTVRREHPRSHRGEPALAALDSLEADGQRCRERVYELLASVGRDEAEMDAKRKRAERVEMERDAAREHWAASMAEIERLREALREIAEASDPTPCTHVRAIARAALGGEE